MCVHFNCHIQVFVSPIAMITRCVSVFHNYDMQTSVSARSGVQVCVITSCDIQLCVSASCVIQVCVSASCDNYAGVR